MLNILARFRKASPPPLPIFPENGREGEWMEAKLARAIEGNRELAVNFFDPTSGDYFPNALHVSSFLTPELMKAYRVIRNRHPDLAAAAARRPTSYSVSRLALPEDLARNRHRIHV